MRKNAVNSLLAGSLISLLVCAGSCRSNSESGPTPTCIQANGVWNVSLDYGSGLIAHQDWTITQTGCDLALTGNPPDLFGPGLPAGPTSGYTVDNGLWAKWVITSGTCRVSSSLDSAIVSSTLTGTIFWIKNASGGPCSSNTGQLIVSGVRSTVP